MLLEFLGDWGERGVQQLRLAVDVKQQFAQGKRG
jgi:hypothetical protein